MSKRLFDVFFSGVGLIVLAPVLLIIALAIKMGDGGRVIYRQARVGREGRLFSILKFRSMREGADRAGPSVTKLGDQRITGVGKFLRASKLDELPQLVNVLKGDMSFVGPRPEVPKYVALYTPAQREVLRLKPGITDLATLEFHDEEARLARADDHEEYYVSYCLPTKIELNLRYAARASFFSDLEIIFRTLSTIISRDRRNGNMVG